VHKVHKPYIHLNDKEKCAIIGILEKNTSYREIREVIGTNHGSIQLITNKYEQTDNINRKTGSGKHMKLNEHDIIIIIRRRNIKYIARRNPFTT